MAWKGNISVAYAIAVIIIFQKYFVVLYKSQIFFFK